MDTNNIDNLFSKFQGQWDIEEPANGHQDRFLDRLEHGRNKKQGFRFYFPVAAVILVLLGLFINYNPQPTNQEALAKVSPKVRETQVYFSAIIKKEMAKIEKENSPETKQMVKDALIKMDELEKDYDKLTRELIKKGENKQLIHAMITNLQTRISFLEDVLTRIENTKKLKEQYNGISQV